MMTALAIDQQIDNHGRSAGTLLAGGGCRGYRPAGEVTEQDRPTLRGRAGLAYRTGPVDAAPVRCASSFLLPLDQRIHWAGRNSSAPFSQFPVALGQVTAALRRAERFAPRLRRSVVKFSRRLSIARRAHYSLADQAPAKIADFAVFRQLERLSCAAVYGPNHSEAPVHATGSFTQGLGNV